MSINLGSNKIGKINVGSEAISKVYKGSELVYQSQKSLPLYAYGDSSGQLYLGGSYSINGFVSYATVTLNAITGTLGNSGSKAKFELAGNITEYSYLQTLTYNGIQVFVYGITNSILYFILEGSQVGSTVLNNFVIFGKATVHPSEFTSTYMVSNDAKLYRYSAGDKVWTHNGIYDA